jgi:hypothetical protein
VRVVFVPITYRWSLVCLVCSAGGGPDGVEAKKKRRRMPLQAHLKARTTIPPSPMTPNSSFIQRLAPCVSVGTPDSVRDDCRDGRSEIALGIQSRIDREESIVPKGCRR